MAGAVPELVVSAVIGIEAGGPLLVSGCVCCILTVALGSAGPLLFGASLGRLMRAVSFFGETGLAITPEEGGAGGGGIMPDGADGGPGFSGMVGLLLSAGGFGGGMLPSFMMLDGAGGAGGPGGLGAGGVDVPEPGTVTFEVSFFGVWTPDWMVDSGTSMRTVSRFAPG